MLTIGKTIKKYRMDRELKMTDIQRELGISAGVQSQWESDARVPNLLTLWELADYYNVSLDELVGRVQSK